MSLGRWLAIKTCIKCGEDKPLSAFILNKNRVDGTDNECRRCRHIRELQPATVEAKRDRDLRRKYGISLSAYQRIFDACGGRCAICEKPEGRTNKYGEVIPLAVDHDHAHGLFRGLLCSNCNTAIGKLGDNPKQLHMAFTYLYNQPEAK